MRVEDLVRKIDRISDRKLKAKVIAIVYFELDISDPVLRKYKELNPVMFDDIVDEADVYKELRKLGWNAKKAKSKSENPKDYRPERPRGFTRRGVWENGNKRGDLKVHILDEHKVHLEGWHI